MVVVFKALHVIRARSRGGHVRAVAAIAVAVVVAAVGGGGVRAPCKERPVEYWPQSASEPRSPQDPPATATRHLRVLRSGFELNHFGDLFIQHDGDNEADRLLQEALCDAVRGHAGDNTKHTTPNGRGGTRSDGLPSVGVDQ